MISRVIYIFTRFYKNPLFNLKIVAEKITKYVEDNFVINSFSNPYLKHCIEYWKRNELFDGPIILCDISESPGFIISNNYFLQILSNKYKGQIFTFSKNKQTNLNRIRSAQNFTGHIQTTINNKELTYEKINLIKHAKSSIISKEDLFNFTVKDIWIGIDIYETYLRYGRPTVDLNDKYLWHILSDAVELVLFWDDYFNKNKVNSVLLTHDCYTYYNSIAKVAYKYKKPVYFCSIYCYQKATEPFSLYSNRFINYKKMFRNLSDEEKIKGINIAKNQIEKRLSGKVGVNMSYSTKSAFHKDYSNQIIKKSKKIKIVICTHCFFDNPHGYGKMMFLDFFEWLNYLGEISKETDYDWYIKTHPDYLPGTIETLNNIIKEYPKFQLLPSSTSFHQLADEKVDFALTCFGSIGHELPFLGIKVINCSYNPHIAYDFNWHAKSKKDYNYMLLNLSTLDKKISLNEIYEFFYIHYYYAYVDDLFFESYSEFTENIKNHGGKKIEGYKYFLSNFNQKKHKKIIRDINLFIESDRQNFFLKGPE